MPPSKRFPPFKKTAILGVGLLGGSLALALKGKKLSKEICGFGRKEENLKRAKRKCIIDSYRMDPREAVKGADLVVLATPVGTFRELAKTIAPALEKDSVQMDMGSVKGSLVYELEKMLPRFVGCHPIAGGDRSGIDSARASLFKGVRCIITKTARTDEDACQRIFELWERLGGRAEIMDPMEHDRVYALVSHLPHLIAYALVNTVGEADPSYIRFAGPGFRDTSRIARSSPELWKDISLLNRENILNFLEVFKRNLEKLETLIEKGDAESFKKALSDAKALREQID